MQLSHIVPVKHLNQIDGRDFHMCLANIAHKNKTYLNFYKKQAEQGKFVLLDNGTAEGEQISIEQVWAIAKQINPSEIVLHDELGDPAATICKSLKSAIHYKMFCNYSGSLMAVPQGESFLDWIKCFHLMRKCPFITTFGISKFLTKFTGDEDVRMLCLEYINHIGKKEGKTYIVHLLGCHINMKELVKIKQANFSNVKVRSNDTALAYIYTAAGRSIADGDRPENEIDFIEGEQNIIDLKQNMKLFDQAVNGGNDV